MLLLQIAIWCALGYAGGWIAARKGYPPHWGVVLGIFGGPIALFIGALLPMTESGRAQAELEREIDSDSSNQHQKKSCPHCGREVAYACLVCPRCDHRFAPPKAEAGL